MLAGVGTWCTLFGIYMLIELPQVVSGFSTSSLTDTSQSLGNLATYNEVLSKLNGLFEEQQREIQGLTDVSTRLSLGCYDCYLLLLILYAVPLEISRISSSANQENYENG